MMRVFARLDSTNHIIEFIKEHEDITQEWHPDFLAACVEVTDLDPQPEMGWVYTDGEFTPPVEPELSPKSLMVQKLSKGCEIKCTFNHDLDATYVVVGELWQQMRDEVLYIVSFDAFSGGVEELTWPTVDGEVTFTDTGDFKKVVRAIGDWLTKWQAYVYERIPEPPTLPVIIGK